MLSLKINGQEKDISAAGPCSLEQVLAELGLEAGRVAVEHNGAIVPRSAWSATAVVSGDRLEIVHFVGGGTELSYP